VTTFTTPAMKIFAGHQYSMVLVSNFTCFGKSSTDNICYGNGICTQKDVCTCGFDFVGIECQFTSCSGVNSSNPNVCSGKGTCTAKDTCLCTKGFGGKDCEINFSNGAQTIVYGCGYNGVYLFL
jgi:hypothetical protein